MAGSITAVDVTDPENPTVAGAFPHDTGFHNCWHHEISGTDYVFTIKDIEQDGTAGVYIFEFDRATGTLELVNTWNQAGNFADGNLTSGDKYIHDIVVQDDPRLEKPVGYLSYWNAGMYALDLSNPTDISVLGHFTMSNAHYAEPAPTYFDGKRVVVAGHEYPSDKNGHSGEVKFLDADGLDGGYTKGEDNIVELDSWEWRDDVSFDGTYTFSPHNFTVTEGQWVHVGHYHGGTRFLHIDSSEWSLTEQGFFQAAKDVPEESKVVGLNHAAPFTWTAVTQDGVTYAADINTGVYALRYKPDSSLSSFGLVAGGLTFVGLVSQYSDRLSEEVDTVR
ncbi:LVIVD repeat-containing protein [Halomicrococcus sp. NG-SE-24]|uniref:LVIVD repeat-containing protein n=1 Tax=Halomicrococcus sp. NG-SE-24 TaxID=3436928 RepID=UPI003D961022